MARLSDEERRARDADKAMRTAAAQARRIIAAERRQAATELAAERNAQHRGAHWVAETPNQRRDRIERQQRARDRAAALKKRDPGKAFVNQHVTAEAQRHGDYVRDTVPGPTIVKAGKEVPTSLTVVRNRGGTTIERWATAGSLSPPQIMAIAMYARAWRLRYGGEQRVTANWSMVASIRGGSAPIEKYIASVQQAKATLEHLDDAVFFGLSLHYFETWRNVVIFDEAAGVAGSRLGFKNDRAEAAAKAIVMVIADMIATELRLAPER